MRALGVGMLGWMAITSLAGAVIQDELRLILPIDRSVTVHRFHPEGRTDPLPTLLMWHGGGWTQGTPELLFPHAEQFAANGYLCLVPEYPLATRETGIVQCVEDAHAMAKALVSGSGSEQIDKAAVYLLGESAGGHLAAMLASDPETYRWAGVILWNPVLDLRTLTWLGPEHGPLPDLAEFSPVERISADHPVTLIIHGADDTVVPLAQAEAWQATALKLNVPCRLFVLPDTQHAFSMLSPGEKSGVGFETAMAQSLAFLAAPKTTVNRTEAEGFRIIHAFSPENGWQPFSELSLHGDTAWGGTHSGGRANRGTLFRLNLIDEHFEVVRHLMPGDGYEPYTGQAFGDDAVWGISKFGGSRKGGTLYRLTPSSGAFALMAEFGPNEDPIAWNPHAGPILIGDTLWGTTFHGGSTRWGGTLYRLPSTGGALEIVQGFSAETGEHPTGQLLEHDGWLYGTLSDFGKTDSGHYGALFRIRLDGSDFEVIHRFAGGGLGAHPYDRLAAHSAGYLLGTTFGIFGDPLDRGTLFAWNIEKETLSTLVDFNLVPEAGGKPNGSVVIEAGGDSILLTTHGSLDTAHDFPGTALRVYLNKPTSTIEGLAAERVEILHTFDRGRHGSTPMRTPVVWGGALWGMTAFGHNSDAKVDEPIQTGGLIYRLKIPPPNAAASTGLDLKISLSLPWLLAAAGGIFLLIVIVLLLRRRS